MIYIHLLVSEEVKYLLLYFLFMIQVMCIWNSSRHTSMKANFLFIKRGGKMSYF